jgi:hypothetical protein
VCDVIGRCLNVGFCIAFASSNEFEPSVEAKLHGGCRPSNDLSAVTSLGTGLSDVLDKLAGPAEVVINEPAFLVLEPPEQISAVLVVPVPARR